MSGSRLSKPKGRKASKVEDNSDFSDDDGSIASRIGRRKRDASGNFCNSAGGAKIIVKDEKIPFSWLPPELVIKIFRLLDTRSKCLAARVCYGWRHAVYSPAVWQDVEVKLDMSKPQTRATLRNLSNRGVCRIRMSNEIGLKKLLSSVPRLTCLNLTFCINVTDQNLKLALLFPLTNLTDLGLSFCRQLTDESVALIAEKLPNLEKLYLNFCYRITDKSMDFISRGLPHLKTLDLRLCQSVTDEGIGHIAGAGAGTGNPKLEQLSLEGVKELTDRGLRYLGKGLPRIKYLDLSGCYGLTDGSMADLARLDDLVDLSLSCSNIGDAGLAHLTRGCKRLSGLALFCLSAVTDVGMGHLAKMKSLRQLELRACRKITDAGLEVLVAGLPDLVELDVNNCPGLGSTTLLRVAGGMKRLRTLKVSRRHVSEEGKQLAASNLMQLHFFNLDGLEQIEQVIIRRTSAGQPINRAEEDPPIILETIPTVIEY